MVPPLHREFQPPGTEGGCLGCDLVGTLMGMALVWDGWGEWGPMRFTVDCFAAEKGRKGSLSNHVQKQMGRAFSY